MTRPPAAPAHPAPFDPGLQPERTLLSWRRTCLSLAVAGAVGVRLTTGALGRPAVLAGLAVVALSAVAYAAASLRYGRAHRGLTAGSPLVTDGLPVAALSAAALGVGLGALALVLGGPW